MRGRVRGVSFMYGERSMTAEITFSVYGLTSMEPAKEFVEAYQSGREVDIQVSEVGTTQAGTAAE